MRIIADLHTHTVASTHAYATLLEMVSAAAEAGLSAIAVTDHGPATPDSPHMYHFANLKVLPRKHKGVVILKGVEANIMNFDGRLDMMEREDILKKLDWVIASMHDPVMPFDCSSEDYTRAWLGVVKNPYVDVLGHMGDGRYPFDYDIVLKEAAKQNKLVELNNNSFRARPGSESNCLLIAQKCKEYGVKVVINSDAHFTTMVGKFTTSLATAREAGIPASQIVNSSVENLADYLNNRTEKQKILF